MSKIEIKELLERLAQNGESKFTGSELRELYGIFSEEKSNVDFESWIKEKWSAVFEEDGAEVEFNNSKGRSNTFVRVFRIVRNAAAILTIPLIIGVLYYSSRSAKSIETFESNLHALVKIVEPSQEYYSPAGTRSKIILEDSTVVWLNGASRLKVASDFGGKIRMVELTGMAYFDVTTNQEIPFVVAVGDMSIKVKGTSFSVNGYEPDKRIETVLVEGAIEINYAGRTTTLSPSQMAVFVKGKNRIEVTSVKTEPYSSWKEGILIFDNTPMIKVIETLENEYNIKIFVTDPAIMRYQLHGKLDNCSIAQIMEYIGYTSPIEYKIDKDKITISLKK